MYQDLRYSIRLLIKKPGFTLIAVATLAVGIGLNSAIFSVVNSVLLRPLPYKDSDRLVQIWSRDLRKGGKNSVISPADYLDWRKQARSFERVSAYNISRAKMATSEGVRQINGAAVTGDFFETLGVTPQLGRAFSINDEQPDKNHVLIISHSFWQTRLGGKTDVIGQTLNLDNISYTIIGVLKGDYRHPEPTWDQTAEFWRPLTLREGERRNWLFLRAIGRLNSGVALEQAQSEMTVIASQLEQAYPKSNANRGATLVSLRRQFTGEIRSLLLILQGAVALVLLIACVNIANLLLARMAAREQEMAIRAAVGAGRLRIVRLLLAEGLTLACLGCAFGLLLARWCMDFLVSLAPREYFRLTDVGLDGWALAFTLLLSLLTVSLFGLAPALHAVRININDTLGDGRSARATRGLRGLLVAGEIALALVLLIGAGLMLRSLANQQNVELGFNSENMLTMQIELPTSIEAPQIVQFYDGLLSRLKTLPGVAEAAVTVSLPLAQSNSQSTSAAVVGQPELKDGAPRIAFYRVVSPGYFGAMGIRLSKGRAFNERDTMDSPPVIIVNETFARRFLQDVDPLRQKIIPGISSAVNPSRPREVVGVVADVRHEGLLIEPQPEMYLTYAQDPLYFAALVVRTTGAPEKMAAAVQHAVQETRSDVSLSQVRSLRQILWELVTKPRFSLVLLGSFAIVALILAAMGIYGVMSYTVTQTTREIGIRMALGAQSIDVMKPVMLQGIRWTSLGVVIGLATSFGLTRLIKSFLVGIGPTDATTFISVALFLAAVALVACWIPARRATRVDPMTALRTE
ncbi:MAG: ABC transporter permease [Chloracidobacterium sp.]|nr:ABC transporter permease [Chloracidobacterium sp.]